MIALFLLPFKHLDFCFSGCNVAEIPPKRHRSDLHLSKSRLGVLQFTVLFCPRGSQGQARLLKCVVPAGISITVEMEQLYSQI
jgi:hypothetical protein